MAIDSRSTVRCGFEAKLECDCVVGSKVQLADVGETELIFLCIYVSYEHLNANNCTDNIPPKKT